MTDTARRQFTGYDVIGDVHGYAGKLEGLLRELDYSETPQPNHPRKQGLWSHANRQAIFIGDLIDRGPQQIRTVDLVREMVEAGHAQMVMGNHEFNAIAWATPNPEIPGEFLRPHSGEFGEGNHRQHSKFLYEVGEGSRLHRDYIDWFRSLPLWLELDGGKLRIVHACWDQKSMDVVKRFLSADRSMTYSMVVEGSREGSAEYVAIETILKGPEIELPKTHWYLDKDGTSRQKARMQWWDPHLTTLFQAADMSGARNSAGDLLPALPDTPLEASAHQPYTDNVPVVFGHYWRTPETVICTETTLCVDFSAGKGGPVVAYRWDSGTFDMRNLVGYHGSILWQAPTRQM